MSTRATYLIATNIHHGTSQNACFYIHHDGYPSGAAGYFYNMHKARKKSTGFFAEHFVRGNSNAEFTRAHDAHCDTAYRYTLDAKGKLQAKKWAYAEGIWEVFYSGPWHDFVNQEGKLPEESRLYEFELLENGDKTIMTLEEAYHLMSNEFTQADCARRDQWDIAARKASAKALSLAAQIDQIEKSFKKN